MFSILISGRDNILRHMTDLFDHEKCGVVSLAMDRARSPTFSEVAVISRTGPSVTHRVIVRLLGLRVIGGIRILARSGSISTRLLLVGIRTGNLRRGGTLLRLGEGFNTEIVSMALRDFALRLANEARVVSRFVNRVSSFNVVRVTQANRAILRENTSSFSRGSWDWNFSFQISSVT